MHLSTIFISSTSVLAGMSAALPVKREDMILARFADFRAEAGAYDEELELYARGSAPSKSTGRNLNPIHRSASREPLLESRPNEDNRPSTSKESLLGSSPTRQHHIAKNNGHTGSPGFSLYSNSKPNVGHRHRRSFDDLD